MSDRRRCVNSPDSFCYTCGSYTPQKQRRNITQFYKNAYKAYFGMPLGDLDKKWAPHYVCSSCTENIRQWVYGKRKSLAFGIPMVWREPKDHITDCYFCLCKAIAMCQWWLTIVGVWKETLVMDMAEDRKKWSFLLPNNEKSVEVYDYWHIVHFFQYIP